MRIARPPSGFSIIVTELAQTALDASVPSVPRLTEVWDGVRERLKFTAHREGDRLPDGRSLLQVDGDPSFGIPKIAVIYTVLGDTVTVHRILVVALQ
ncbi:MAG: hypothetical protein Q8L23_08380 [Caulobacter sp.]|jgi:hypothetical protein|nr:hypothetical protein [Caulobacter sp.]